MLDNKLIANVIFLLFFITNNSSAQPSKQWGNLKSGPFTVGFKTLQGTDYSRTYFSRGRPINMYIWYPAIHSNEKYMKFKDYFEAASLDWGREPGRQQYLKHYFLTGFKNGPLNPSFPGGISEDQFQTILNTRVPVVKNALPVKQKFPVLLHLQANGALHQSVMLEHLASYGYVVVSISMYSSYPAFYGRGEDGANALLNLTEDLGFVLGKVKKLLNADIERTAMIGMLAQVGLSLQMKDISLKALACLDCSWQEEALQQLPYYEPRKIRIPILEVVNTQFKDQKKTFLDSLPYATRYIARLKNMPHADFYPFPLISLSRRTSSHTNYELVVGIVLQFLNMALKDASDAKDLLRYSTGQTILSGNLLPIRIVPAQKKIPLEHEVLYWLRYGPIEKAKDAFNTFGKHIVSPSSYFVTTLFLARDREPQASDAVLLYASHYPQDERLGMLFTEIEECLLLAKDYNRAIRVLTEWAATLPNLPYPYKSLARVYMQLNRIDEAKLSLKKAIEATHKSEISPNGKTRLIQDLEEMLKRL